MKTEDQIFEEYLKINGYPNIPELKNSIHFRYVLIGVRGSEFIYAVIEELCRPLEPLIAWYCRIVLKIIERFKK